MESVPVPVSFPVWMIESLKKRFSERMSDFHWPYEPLPENGTILTLVPPDLIGEFMAEVTSLECEGADTAEAVDAWLRGGCK